MCQYILQIVKQASGKASRIGCDFPKKGPACFARAFAAFTAHRNYGSVRQSAQPARKRVRVNFSSTLILRNFQIRIVSLSVFSCDANVPGMTVERERCVSVGTAIALLWSCHSILVRLNRWRYVGKETVGPVDRIYVFNQVLCSPEDLVEIPQEVRHEKIINNRLQCLVAVFCPDYRHIRSSRNRKELSAGEMS